MAHAAISDTPVRSTSRVPAGCKAGDADAEATSWHRPIILGEEEERGSRGHQGHHHQDDGRWLFMDLAWTGRVQEYKVLV